MEIKTRTQQILTVMRILAWVAFIGFIIEAGVMIISYGISLMSPEAARNLYRGLDLYKLKEFNFWHYTCSASFIVAISCLKAFVSFLVIKTLSMATLENPFKMEVAVILEKISRVLLGTWCLAMLSNAHSAWVLKRMGELQGNWISGEFIFMAGLVFIISQVFKRGVEIQSENDLTV
jgi:hypothetical protein